MKNKRLETENEVRKRKSLSFGCLEGEETQKDRERSREVSPKSREPFYRKVINLDRSRAIEKLSSFKKACFS